MMRKEKNHWTAGANDKDPQRVYKHGGGQKGCQRVRPSIICFGKAMMRNKLLAGCDYGDEMGSVCV